MFSLWRGGKGGAPVGEEERKRRERRTPWSFVMFSVLILEGVISCPVIAGLLDVLLRTKIELESKLVT